MTKKEKKQKLGKLASAAKRARKGKQAAESAQGTAPVERSIVGFDQWQPAPVPAAESATLPPYSSDAAYSCTDDAYAGRKKTVVVDFLYLDLTVCERCQGADKRVERAVELCRPVLAACGYDIVLNSVNVDNEWLAEQYRFYSSPTVRVNDVDTWMRMGQPFPGVWLPAAVGMRFELTTAAGAGMTVAAGTSRP